ncbi:hypothetical protein QJS04_geneDACA003302 [Acorus gramineus]|uniref:Uncharacterized protein n=1 Tax=Acorus gramineus TaxID=55184 RepID=A0AAV9BM06_ACOGR|nr:hypothetical protein QJS04_geneDACA003302 [Acorus gramineus]
MKERREAEAKIKRGWVVFNEAFILINDVLEGQIKNLDKNQWMGIYTGFYDMCVQRSHYFPGGHSQIYETYGEKLKSYCEVRVR